MQIPMTFTERDGRVYVSIDDVCKIFDGERRSDMINVRQLVKLFRDWERQNGKKDEHSQRIHDL